jgi:flagellar biosynthesis chaperone FliJ
MTINPRVVRALRDARLRLRDVAVAEHSLASTARASAAQQVDAAKDELEDFLDAAATTLTGLRSIYDLDRIADVVSAHHVEIATATQSHDTAVAMTEAAADRLRDRTRQLKTAERLVEVSDKARADRDHRTEQRGSDDMTGARRR